MGGDDIKFELDRLVEYDAAALIRELQRVASITPTSQPLTYRVFNEHSKAHATTVKRRFGGWSQALQAAGLADRYSGRAVTEKMKTQHGRGIGESELVQEMRRIAALGAGDTLTTTQFDSNSSISSNTVTRRFGSWAAALKAAGLRPVVMGRRYSDEDFFENLLTVWTFRGRQPRYGEMNAAPSTITAGGYERRFGGWTRALVAFVDYANGGGREPQKPSSTVPAIPAGPVVRQGGGGRSSQRSIPLGIRYDVLKRDNFKCAICGRSPATDSRVTLHVDHVIPFSRGGMTTPDNLRALCSDCNLGKSAKP